MNTAGCNGGDPLDIQSWMDLFLKELQNVFKNRLVFVGLQGSRGRGEGRPDSDIDAVVVLDRLTPADLDVYEGLLGRLPNRELVCGFVSGREELAAWEDEDGYVTLEFSPSSGETEQHRFLVVGTYAGGAGRLYCPWWVARQLCLDVYGAITMDSLSAAMADNRRIDQFWDEYGSRYFVEPTRDGTPVPWEGYLMYRTYPFALAIYDDTLVKTVDQLHQNQKLLGLVSWLLGLSAFGVGAVFSILLLRHRSRELKLQYILGQARGGILLWALVEHGLLSLLGAAIGAGGFCVAFRTAPAWGPVAVFWGMNLAGTALAYLLTMRRTFLETNLGRE